MEWRNSTMHSSELRERTMYRNGRTGDTQICNVFLNTVQARRDDWAQLADDHEEDRQNDSGRGCKEAKPVSEEHCGVRYPLRNMYMEERDTDSKADERSRAFFGARVKAHDEMTGEVVSGEREMMMVRMLAEGWEKLSWISVAAGKAGMDSGKTDTIAPTATRKSRQADLVNSLMFTRSSSGPLQPATISATPSRDHVSPSSESLNPFRQSKTSGIASEIVVAKPDDVSFRSSEKRKERFDGHASVGGTRRRMKMFDGARS